MRCSKFEQLFLTSLDGEIDPKNRAAMQQHQVKCSRCAAIAQDYILLNKQLNTVIQTEEESPPWLQHRILDAVRTHDSRRKVVKRWWNLQAVPVSMAVLASLYMGVLVGRTAFSTVTNSAVEQEYVSMDYSSILYYETGDSNE